ncbi:hypothetical protein M406DRAFT_350954 [Cryphonectria parasitica EP155]|uniref:Uncharacterized protein n=1 Tax=Cryphonectria parasitica (strain ATCC 38755 / EP155) TaxID=660469 RepID=A0A9P4Y2B2_CRYP1|nr:uncharacterized protein M406DRAFT_350954 [Cryphonectria parasitica EP155]KAF3765343.1 hypothetical protein M406DRAFT_350954 [Cryphonectria parasitica EP155]
MRFSYAIVALVSLATALPTQGPIEDRSPCSPDECYQNVRTVVFEERTNKRNQTVRAVATSGPRRSLNLVEVDTRDVEDKDVQKRVDPYPQIDVQVRGQARGLGYEQRRNTSARAVDTMDHASKQSRNLFRTERLQERGDGLQVEESA